VNREGSERKTSQSTVGPEPIANQLAAVQYRSLMTSQELMRTAGLAAARAKGSDWIAGVAEHVSRILPRNRLGVLSVLEQPYLVVPL
jgi:hypothetical protein